MSRPEKAPGGLPRVVSLRLTQSEFAQLESKRSAAGFSRSEFFRQAVITNRTKVVERPRPTVDYRRLVFLFSKASNNLNQLAHRANSAHQAGLLDHQTLDSMLYELESIRQFLKQATPAC